MCGYYFSSIETVSLDQIIELGHISDKQCMTINKARRNKGVDEIDFPTCFEAGISWWKDAQSRTRNGKVKAHKEIHDWDPRANWFPNWQGRLALRRFESVRPRGICSYAPSRRSMFDFLVPTRWLGHEDMV